MNKLLGKSISPKQTDHSAASNAARSNVPAEFDSVASSVVAKPTRGLISIGKAAKYLGVSIDTLRNWEEQKKLVSIRTAGGSRRYRLTELKKFAIATPKLARKIEQHSHPNFEDLKPISKAKIPASIYTNEQQGEHHLGYAPSPIARAIKQFNPSSILPLPPPFVIKDKPRHQVANHLKKALQMGLGGIVAAGFIVTAIIVGSYFINPRQTNQHFAHSSALSPFNSLAKGYLSMILPQKARELGLKKSSVVSPQSSDNLIADSEASLKAENSSNVLAIINQRPGTLNINANTAINGTLLIEGGVRVTGTDVSGLLQSITGGDNVTIVGADSPNPTISVTLPSNLVNSFATSSTGTKVSGDIILGSGLSLATATKTISVSTPTLSSVRSAGGCSGCITDDDVDSALTISSSGSVAVGALSSAVTIAKGGTALTSYTTGDILYANSSGTLSKLAIGTSGQSLVVTSGLPAWSSSGAGVTSLNSLTGELTIAGTSNQISVAASSTTVTLSLPSTVTTTNLNASSALQLNGTNINTGGTLSNVAYLDTAQTFSAAQTNSTAGAASTPAQKLTGAWYTGGSGTTTKPQLLIEPSGTTTNAWSTSGTGIGVNAAATFAGNLIDLQQAANSIFSITSVSSAVNGFNFLAGATGSGVAISADGGGSDTNIALSIDAKGSGLVKIAATSTGNVELAGGSAATGCTIANSTGALTCAGDITGGSTGTSGYWTRSGTTLSPATAGDAITTSGNLSTSGSGTLSIAGTATFSSTINTNTFSSTALTFASGATTAVISPATAGTHIEVDSGGGTGNILLGGGSGSTGCTVSDSTGNLTCAGSITGGSESNQGYWSRSGTTLSPVTTGDAITTSGNISTSGSGAVTSAGLLTGQLGLTITGATTSINASSNFATNINTGTSTGTISLGNSSAGAIAISGSSTFGVTTTTSAQTFTSAVVSGTTTSSAFVFTDSSLTTGTGLYLVSSSLTSGKLAHIAPTFAGAGVTGYGAYLEGADSTTSANTDYQLYSTLALSGNAAKTGVGIYSTVTSSSTTGDTLIGLDLATSATGALAATQTRTIYGLRSQPASTGASNNSDDTLNLYGSYLAPTSTLALAGTTNVYGQYISNIATHNADAGTVNSYGLYIANGTSSTNGTNTKYGLYIATPTGADTNYALYIAGGNATLADGALLDLSAINLSSTTEGLLLPQNATACSSATAEGQICWDTSTDTLYIGKSGSTAAVGQGDITAVGSMTSGAAFADSGADDDWLGLGSGAGRIEFDDQTTDEVNILSANVGIGTQTPGGSLDVSAAKSLTPSLTGAYLSFSASTLTDSGTAASGTLANAAFNSIAAPTLAATNTSVVTDHAYTLYLAGPPTAGTNETINNSYALGVNGKTQLANAVELSGSTDATTTVGTRVEGAWSVTNLAAGTNTYNYRRAITVTNNDSSTALPTNYELTITLTTGASSQSSDVCATTKNDSSDLIVAKLTGPTEIARNITRTSCAAGSQQIVVKFLNQASIAASGTATYYLYYGNSGSSNTAPTTYSTSAVVLDSADNVGSWTSNDSTNFAISQETTIKQEGTGSIKAVAVQNCSTCGDIGVFATTNQGQLPTTRAYFNTTESVVIGGTGYLYFIGGDWAPVLSTVYKSTITTAGDLGSFVTTSQAQLPLGLSYMASNIVDVGGTNYIYIIGGYNPTTYSSVYKAQIGSTGNIGAFATTSQGQMLELIWQNASTVASISGTSYIYVLGDADGNTSAVYKGMINPANGDVGSFATTSQGQLKVATVFGDATTVTIGGTNYVYIVGGNTISTVYKAQIDTSANIGSFNSTSQGQLPAVIYNPAVNPFTIGGTNYLYVSGGEVSTVYRATLDGSGNVGSFVTTGQAQFPAAIRSLSNIVTLGTSSYFYGLGNGSASVVYKGKITTTYDPSGDVGAFSTTSQGQLLATRLQLGGALVAVGGTNYIYAIGGDSASTVYKAQIGSSGNVGSFDTTSQGQLPANIEQIENSITTATVGGTNYVYLAGGSGGGSALYRTQVDASGNLGSFVTTSQGQLKAARYGTGAITVNQAGTYYLYNIAGWDGGAATSTVYKSQIDTSGNVGSFDTTSQGQLLATRYGVMVGQATIGGTSYLYALGGCSNGSCGADATSTVYKAQIGSSGNVGSFDTTSQGQLPAKRWEGAVVTLSIMGNFLYVIGGDAGTGATPTSTVYKAAINSTGDIGSFVTTGQAQLPANNGANPAVVTNTVGFSYLYTLGGTTTSTVYKASLGGYGAQLTTSAKNLTDLGGLQMQVYSSRTGTYLTYDVSEDGVTWTPTSNSITISSANTWETKQLDISGTANGAKDGITRVRVRASDTTSGFTMYFDDMSGISTAFSGSSPSVAQAARIIGAANLMINAQGTGLVRVNYDANSNTIAGSGGLTVYNGATTAYLQVDANGNVVVGQGAALATTATNGFLYLPSSAGLPTGVPTSYTGSLAMEYDSTNNKLCVYNAAWKCSAALSDFAEWAPARGAEIGDIVVTTDEVNPIEDSASPFMLGKSSIAYDQKIVGVISKYAEDSNDAHGYKRSDDYHAVALAGRVPVKIASNSAAIKRGDYLTSSSTPGQAMKATKPGQIVGKALEDYDPLISNKTANPGMVLAFIQPGFADPQNALANLSIEPDGTLLVPKLKVGELGLDTKLFALEDRINQLSLTSTNTEDNLLLNKLAASSETIDPINVASKLLTLDQIQATQTATLAKLESRILSNESNISDKVASLSAQIASLSAKLANKESDSESLSKVLAAQIVQLSEKINSLQLNSSSSAIAEASSSSVFKKFLADDFQLTSPDTLLATGSSQLASLAVASEATFSGRLIAYDTIISNSFKSLGETFLGQTTIAEEVNVDGTLSVTGNAINSIGTLYLQSAPLSTKLDIFGGKLVIDIDGNLTTSGDIKATNLEITGALITRADAGEDITIGDVVYITEAGTIKRANASDDSSSLVVGIAAESAEQNKPVRVAISGRVGGFKNLQVGKPYFLGNNGKLLTVPTKADTKVIQVAIAFNENSLLVQIHPDASINSKVLGISASAEVDPSFNLKSESPSGSLKELINNIDQQEASGSASSSKTLTVNNNTLGFLRVRSNPTVTAEELTKLNIGDKFPVLEQQNGWFKIEYTPANFGWVLGSYVSVK
ncbi:hypothetical protein A2631_01160 [Candidatus Daviesbacteria bacterium RIFCSPHIGHO2_01_FULL_44_29]|nr:MAG: hypothetical protein A2631_01160 [Candidatus Daviesbacteria bacterium RIFCSPHIGHO2_01_FULL_44_29]OGE69786.1 MAG: hypothetical protein A3B55_05225 [Candidatus Daviesbacteria bacterium RIFCSPLOWO2_01_FULL_43_15]